MRQLREILRLLQVQRTSVGGSIDTTTIERKLDLILKNEGIIMTDLTALKSVADRLQAGSKSELALLQSIKDQNTSLAAQLATVQTGDPTTQAAIDAVVQQLTTTADDIDAAVAANPNTPNLTPSPDAVPAPAPDATA